MKVFAGSTPVPRIIDIDFSALTPAIFAAVVEIFFQCHTKDGARISKKRMGLRIGDRKGQSGPL